MSGGGMRCVYGVGVLTALVEEYGITEPDIIVAASGSVANAAYYLSGQYTAVISAWLAVLSGKRFISYRRRRIIDIDYLVDYGFKILSPMDFKTLRSKKTLFFLATTRVTDGKTVYMKLPKNKKVYECLRAAKAIPVIYGKEVCIRKSCYIDGDFGTSTEDLIAKALSLGAQDVVVVENNKEIQRRKVRRFVLGCLYFKDWMTGQHGAAVAIRRELKEPQPSILRKGTRLLRITPTKPLPVKLLERRKLHLRLGFNLGYADTAGNKKLKKLLA